MEAGQQPAGLGVGVLVPLDLGALDELSGQVLGDEDVGALVGLHEPRRPAVPDESADPLAMGGDLAADVVVVWPRRLDDEVPTLVPDV